MKIKVIGSGSMWNEFNSACYMIDDDIMVDFPNGACKYLYRLNIIPNTINNILLTHFHGDHYFDIPFYILNKAKSDNKIVNIYCSEEGKEKINQIGNLAFPNSFDEAINELDINYNFENSFIVNDYKVYKYLVDHGRMKPAYGYIIEKDDIKIGFSGDTTLCDNLEYMSSVCNYLFLDCMLINASTKHMGIDKLEYLIDKYPNCKYVVSHLENDTREKLNKLNYKNVIVPNDGYTIEL